MLSFLLISVVGASAITSWELGKKFGKRMFGRSNNHQLVRSEVIDAEVVEELGPYRTNALTEGSSVAIVPVLPSTSKKKPKRIRWAWYGSIGRFMCPKCRELQSTAYQPAYCECDDTEHFHFACKACKFEALMETADKRK